ncbi:MAG: PD-(D/E)XK nuclease family protein [Weeksellaceae bacterium]
MENFLKSIKLIISKYKEIEKITGEHYNIFSVMGMENNEVKTHSAIIGDLLNPNGSHFMGDVFLKLFIDSVFTQSEYENLNEFTFQTQNSNCIVEESVGKKNDEEITGGRIDIVLKDLSNNIIVIENKIFAPEQDNQIRRYKNTYSEAAILYLTLFGDEPKNIGELKKGIDFYLISYKEDIIRWLELCLKETVNQPILRETLKQYIVLLKKLTNQSTNKKMSDEIVKIINENFEASAEIYSNFEKALMLIEEKFLSQLKLTLENDFRDWEFAIKDYKSTNSIELKKENILIRYRIKNHKHSVFYLEGVNSVKNNPIGFTDKNFDDKTKCYWYLENIDINPQLVKDLKNTEIYSKIQNIIHFVR